MSQKTVKSCQKLKKKKIKIINKKVTILKNTNTKTMSKINTFREHLQQAIQETCDLWDTDYNSDNWEPEFMTIFVTWQLIVTLDSIRNSCDVWTKFSPSFYLHLRQVQAPREVEPFRNREIFIRLKYSLNEKYLFVWNIHRMRNIFVKLYNYK